MDEVAFGELISLLKQDNANLRKAGCDLAEAALRVIREYDGCHRLSIAVSGWAMAVALEGGRDKYSIAGDQA